MSAWHGVPAWSLRHGGHGMLALSWISALVFIVYPLTGINIGIEASHWPEGLVLGSVWQGMLWFSKNPDTFAHLFGFGSHSLLFMFAFSLSSPLYQVSSLLAASLCQLPWGQPILHLHPPQGPLPAPCPESSY